MSTVFKVLHKKRLFFMAEETIEHKLEICEKDLKKLQERDRLEDEHREEKDRIAAIFHNIGEGVVVLNAALKIIMINPSVSYLIGVDPEEAVDKSYRGILRFVDHRTKKVSDDFIHEAMHTGTRQTTHDYISLVIRDDKELPIMGAAIPLKDLHGELVGCVVGFQIFGYQTELEQAKSEFLMVAAHQLRAPLTPIKLFTEMLDDEATGSLNEVQKDYLIHIRYATDRMIQFVDSLLYISRLEVGKLTVDPQQTVLEHFLNETIKNIQDSFVGQGREITFSPESEKLSSVLVDRNLLRMIVKIVIANALKYSQRNNSPVAIALHAEKEYYVIEIRDWGVGIPPEDQIKMFTKFFRAPTAVKIHPEGAGLDLYMVKKILAMTGGDIWFHSKPGDGTTFFITLPRAGMKQRSDSLI